MRRPSGAGSAQLHDAIFWEHEGNRAVRQGKWKLVSQFEKKTWELYDIEADRTEMNDLAGAQPVRARRWSSSTTPGRRAAEWSHSRDCRGRRPRLQRKAE